MAKYFQLIFIFAVFSLNANAQLFNYQSGPMAAYKSEGLWHFIDHSGKELFPAKDLIDVYGYSEGLFRVKLYSDDIEKWAFLDEKGEKVLEIEAEYVFDFNDSLAMTIKKNKYGKYKALYGFINRQGKTVIPNNYIDALPFTEGLAYVRGTDGIGFIGKDGKMALNLDNMLADSYVEGLARVYNSDQQHPKQGFIDKDGKLVVPFYYDEVADFSDGLAFFHNNGTAGYINHQGDTIVRPRFYDGKPFSEGRAFVGLFMKGNMVLWGIVDTNDVLIAKYQFSDAQQFSQGYAAVKTGKGWGFVNLSGELVIYPDFRAAGSFYNGLAFAILKNDKSEKYGYINTNGKFEIEIPKTKQVFDFRMNKKVY